MDPEKQPELTTASDEMPNAVDAAMFHYRVDVQRGNEMYIKGEPVLGRGGERRWAVVVPVEVDGRARDAEIDTGPHPMISIIGMHPCALGLRSSSGEEDPDRGAAAREPGEDTHRHRTHSHETVDEWGDRETRRAMEEYDERHCTRGDERGSRVTWRERRRHAKPEKVCGAEDTRWEEDGRTGRQSRR